MTATSSVLRYEADEYKLDAMGNFVIERGPDGKLALVLVHRKGDPVVMENAGKPKRGVVIPTVEGIDDEAFYTAQCQGFKGTREQWVQYRSQQTMKESVERSLRHRHSYRDNGKR